MTLTLPSCGLPGPMSDRMIVSILNAILALERKLKKIQDCLA